MAIGRHGNFLHWGFAALSDDMTDEARDVFANAVVYIAGFAGKRRSPANITTALSPGMILRFVLFGYPPGLCPERGNDENHAARMEDLKHMICMTPTEKKNVLK